MRGRYVDCSNRRSGCNPSAFTISNWYFSTVMVQSNRGKQIMPQQTKRTIAGKVAQGQSGLALYLQARAVHELYETRHEFGLALRQLLTIGT